MPARAPAARVPGRVHLEVRRGSHRLVAARESKIPAGRTSEGPSRNASLCTASTATPHTARQRRARNLRVSFCIRDASARRDGARAQSQECAGAFSRPPDDVQDSAAAQGGGKRIQTREPRERCTPACGHHDVREASLFFPSTYMTSKFLHPKMDVVGNMT